MNYKEFFRIIKDNALAGAYLLHGEEEFIKNAAVNSVRELLTEELRTFNQTLLYEPDLKKLIEACETLPVFTDKTYVIAKELASSVDAKKLSEYVKTIGPETVLLIVCKGKLDDKNAVLTAFKAQNREVLFDRVDEMTAVSWCVKTAKKNTVTIGDAEARSFIALVTTDMTAVSSELTKLIDRVGPGGTITEEVIAETSIGSIDAKTFAMLNMFINGRTADALRSLRILMNESRDSKGMMIGFLQSRVRNMLRARLLLDSGLSPAQAAAKLPGSKYAAQATCRDAGKYTAESLVKLLSDISLIRYNSIAGKADAGASLETALVSFDWRGRAAGSNLNVYKRVTGRERSKRVTEQ